MEKTDPDRSGAVGIFDSGYGGLTVLSGIKSVLPEYDYIYLGDNARAPYGNRSFERVYEFTLEAVKWFFKQGCHLVILACNTASAKALRTIQQVNLPQIDPDKRVLGVIRPTAEQIGLASKSGHIGVMGTEGTIQSKSYQIEISKLHPHITVIGEACPMWVPLVENREYDKPGADYFIKQHVDNLLTRDPQIDTIILGCTHYPLLMEKIRRYLPENISIISQGEVVAYSLKDYLRRHPEIDEKCTKGGTTRYFTTDSPDKFTHQASIFLEEQIVAEYAML
ncbi:MAG TPA: glutamate racemase [Fermentimonas caenicola]|uniref:Glutamate racemase n=1 Tax=Fermentimonas caenicola TaxID=1562970 RepID=A0A098BZL0_9BACT|nr:glutamate racemase [Lascolabacillus sp.]MBP6176127.1 glutamate racemase [Fermentimonas sp.]MDI9625452.1 glutamate racemase [Bacteroidota bacterium]TAH60716.1 MAG: glutamate racemase [Fermentimonas caenicola]MBP7105009.1 glutamate racemase [Fermentimonas sp.]MCK9500590.1 glutamate racemase [Lascolabacillus sp.]